MAKASKEQPASKKAVSPFEFEDITESLTDRQKLFCMYYVGECKFNGTKAAEMAGYDVNNCGSYSVYLLKNPNISQFIDSAKKDLGLRIGITAEMIAKEYAEIGFSKITDVIGEGNKVLDVTKIGDKSKLVLSVKNTTTETEHGSKTITEVKLHDKLGALDKLAKMIGVDGVTKVASTDNDGNTVPQSPTVNVYNSGPKLANNEDEVIQ